MNTRTLLLWILGGSAFLYLVLKRNTVASTVETGVADMTAVLKGWQNVGQGPKWAQVLADAEDMYGIPRNLLARVAYQESHFKQSIIDGTEPSDAGALGMMQLMPQFFSTVQVPVPFSDTDITNQIEQAAQQLVALYNHFQDWGLALAGYNDGQQNTDDYLAGKRTLPKQTTDYVAQVLADVPVGPGLPA